MRLLQAAVDRSPPTTSGLETEWNYSGRKGRDGQKKKISKAKERKEKVKAENMTK